MESEKLKAMALIDAWVLVEDMKAGFWIGSDEHIRCDVWQKTWRSEYIRSRELLRGGDKRENKPKRTVPVQHPTVRSKIRAHID